MIQNPFDQDTIAIIKSYTDATKAHHALWMEYQRISAPERLSGYGWSLGERCKAEQQKVWLLLAEVEAKRLVYPGSTDDWNENWLANFPIRLLRG